MITTNSNQVFHDGLWGMTDEIFAMDVDLVSTKKRARFQESTDADEEEDLKNEYEDSGSPCKRECYSWVSVSRATRNEMSSCSIGRKRCRSEKIGVEALTKYFKNTLKILGRTPTRRIRRAIRKVNKDTSL